MNHRTVNRQIGQSSYRPAAQSDGMGFSRTTTESAGSGTRSFAQDFNMEHSASARTVTRVRVSTASNQADPAASLSCVYLG
jgi:hypothetical protein